MTQTKMAKLVRDLERAESRMLRAIGKWMKLRAQTKRAGAKMDKATDAEFIGKLEGLPGKMDVRDMPIKPRPWPKKTKRS